jgi:hypothetical protein
MTVAGGTFQVAITTASQCQWTVSTREAWIRPVGAASGQGAGAVVMAVDSTLEAGRHGAVTVSWTDGNVSVGVDQGCLLQATVVNLTAEAQQYRLSGGSKCGFFFPVTVDVPWMSFAIDSAQSENLFVTLNTGGERTGHVTTPFGQITIVQGAGNCVTSIAPTSQSFDENGGRGTFTVTAVAGCAWQATPRQDFGALTIISGGEGSGNGVVMFDLGYNTDPSSRAPYFVVGGSLRFQVTQSQCPVTVPLNVHVPAAGGSSSLTVTSGPICHWFAFNFTNFVTLTSSREVRGPGTVEFSVAPNQTGRTRFGELFIAEKYVLVTQDP